MTLEDVEVQDLVHECGKIWRDRPNIIEGYRKALLDGSMKCPVCTYPNGSKRSMKQLWVCVKCRQTCLMAEVHYCYCIPKNNNVVLEIKYPYKKEQTNPEISRRDSEIENAKSQRILKARIELERKKPYDRQERIEKLLEKLVEQKVKSSAV